MSTKAMHNILEHKDCLEFIKTIPEHSIELAILDPPYNVQADKWDNIDNYLEWMQNILKEVQRVLKDSGSLYLWGMSKNNDFLRLKIWLDENYKLEFKNWIVWIHECKIHKRPNDRYLTKHEDLLFYAGKNATFHIERDEPTEMQLRIHKGKYNQNFFIERESLPPSQQKIFKNGLQLGSPAKSWWKGPSNQSNAKVYNNFMGYKSEWVCERIIKVSSNEGDNVLIPFAGYGTECISCLKLDRNYIACEKDIKHFNIAQKRVQNAQNFHTIQNKKSISHPHLPHYIEEEVLKHPLDLQF